MAFAFATLPVAATAMCGTGQSPSYDDVSAVMFERQGCGGMNPHPPKDLSCSLYWVFITQWDSDGATYSQANLPEQMGTYKLDVTFPDVRALLRAHDFFSLNPEDHFITDISHSMLTVKRCGVVTRIMMYPPPTGTDEATATIFSAFDKLVARSKKHQLSGQPTPPPRTLFFGVP
jgi:hypothetical protein